MTMFRSIALGTAAATLALSPVAAAQDDAAPLPSAHGYEPQDSVEQGLWYEMAQQEKLIAESKLVIDDPELNQYVRGVLCRSVGEERCAATRIYIVRVPYFNASMAPNGMMLVYSGLLLRMRNEAQLAAVLGHEFTHFEQQHSLRLFKSARKKTNLLSFLGFVPIPYFAMASQFALIGSVFSFNRDMEREADAGSIEELVRGGYDPAQASVVWRQLGAEMDATAKERDHKSRKNKNGGMFGTHPRSTDRMETLAELARAQALTEPGVTNAAEYRAALGDWWPKLIDDQVRMQDFGASEYLLDSLALDGWSGQLLHAKGELYRARGNDGDFDKAAEFFRSAMTYDDAPALAWRGLGLALMKQGRREEGQAMLREYLEREPDADDAALLAMMAGES